MAEERSGGFKPHPPTEGIVPGHQPRGEDDQLSESEKQAQEAARTTATGSDPATSDVPGSN